MKKIFNVFLIAVLVLFSVKAFADFTAKKDNQNPPLGRFEIINIKTGGSGQVVTSGEILTLDETNLTGVNWQSLNAIGVAGMNWVGANITDQGINWSTVTGIDTSNINWSGTNFSAGAGSIKNGINWTSANETIGAAGGVNWESLRVSFGNSATSTNWQAFGV